MITSTIVLYMALTAYIGSKTVDYLNENYTNDQVIEIDNNIEDVKIEDPMTPEETIKMIEEFEKEEALQKK